ncbi:MAG TPA: ABC transporter ATP-binding protein [Candidatus Saccharimonadia bacterium]
MRPKTPRQTIRLFWRATRGYRGWMSMHMLTVALAVTTQNVITPYLLAQGVRLTPGYLQHPTGFWNAFGTVITWYLICQVATWTFWRLSGWAMTVFEIRVESKLHLANFEHLSGLSYHFFSSNFTGSLVNQANKLVGAFERLYDTLSFDIMPLIVRTISSVVVISVFAPGVALGMSVFFVVYVVAAIGLAMWKIPISAAAAAGQTRATGRLADNLTNISAIKYFAHERSEVDNYRAIVLHNQRLFTRDWATQEIINAIQAILLIGFESVVFVVSVYLITKRQIDLGQFVLIQAYIWSIFGVLWGVGRVARNVERSLADAAEMTTILATPAEVQDKPIAPAVTIKRGAVEFQDVVFAYHEAGKSQPVFGGLNLKIAPGERVGLVGTSGGGKTTVTKLILRLMDIDSGAIMLDGHDIADMRQADVRRAISYVPQEPLLFHRSLEENIAYGRPGATAADVRRAARRAHAAEFIERLPEKYDTLVGERGIKLSGGQRQRVAIARAMLKDAPVLMLDEATSALDSESEKLIQDALWRLMEGRTAIVIAHRLSTIQRLDRIIVLDRGEIAEQGTHAQLLAKGGIYATLWNHQSGGFIDGED